MQVHHTTLDAGEWHWVLLKPGTNISLNLHKLAASSLSEQSLSQPTEQRWFGGVAGGPCERAAAVEAAVHRDLHLRRPLPAPRPPSQAGKLI